MAQTHVDLLWDSDKLRFESEVLEASHTGPVLAFFLSPKSMHSLEFFIDKEVRAANGAVNLVKFRMGPSYVDRAEKLGVRISVPGVYAYFGGRQIDMLTGWPSEDEVKRFIDRMVKAVDVKAPVGESNTSESTAGGGIFISYRRSDDPGFAGRLYNSLKEKFGEGRLFMDVDNKIPDGADFIVHLSKELEKCDVVLAVIGRNWRGKRKRSGPYQIQREEDYVRVEIASALDSGKRVIPVLIEDTQFPSAVDLPVSIKSLTRLQARRIRHDNFGSDMQRLINSLNKVAD